MEITDPLLEHVLECETCLSVIVDLTRPTEACEQTCPEYRAIMLRLRELYGREKV